VAQAHTWSTPRASASSTSSCRATRSHWLSQDMSAMLSSRRRTWTRRCSGTASRTSCATAAFAGIDPLRQPVPITPAAHYTMGGIATDLDGRASIAGLFAAGECARTGVHGANRLASNSLLEAAAFGRRAAAAAVTTPPIVGSVHSRAHVWRRGEPDPGRRQALTRFGRRGLTQRRAASERPAGFALRDELSRGRRCRGYGLDDLLGGFGPANEPWRSPAARRACSYRRVVKRPPGSSDGRAKTLREKLVRFGLVFLEPPRTP